MPNSIADTAKSTREGYIASVLAAVCWSLTGPGVKYVDDRFSLEPLALAFWRVVIMAAALLIGLLIFKRDRLFLSKTQFAGVALSGVVGIGIYQALFVYSIQTNGAAIGIVLVYLFPAFVTLGSRVLFQESLSKAQILALLLSLLGCALLVRLFESGASQPVNLIGAGLGIASAAAQAAYTLFNRRLSQRFNVPAISSLTYNFVFGAATLAALAAVGARQATFNPNPASLPWIAALALGPTLGGYGLFNLALSKLSGRLVSLIVIAEVPMAAILGVLFLRETLDGQQIAGIILVMTAITLPTLLAGRPDTVR